MWLRCRSSQSGHEASIPVDLVESGAMPDWTPLKGAEPSATFADPSYSTATPEPASKPRTASKTKNKEN